MKKYILILFTILFSNNLIAQISFEEDNNSKTSDLQGDFKEGLAKIKKNGKWGFVNNKGEVIIKLNYDFVDDFSEGLAPVKQNGKYGYIDKTGKVIIPINLNYLSVGRFFEGFAFYLDSNGKFGSFNKIRRN